MFVAAGSSEPPPLLEVDEEQSRGRGCPTLLLLLGAEAGRCLPAREREREREERERERRWGNEWWGGMKDKIRMVV
jgi:hypothetical protein